MISLRGVFLIAKSVLIEAVRRREIYVIVLAASLLIGMVMSIDFFDIKGLTKFYRETALKVMGMATAATVIVLAARQLPREFERRTIYPLMARPISRLTFIAGKLLGVMFSAVFCFALFMLIFVFGTWRLGGEIPWGLFLQHIYLQLLMLLILATLSFWLSMLMNFDAALTVGALFYFSAAFASTVILYLYDSSGTLFRWFLLAVNYGIPQLTLFDLSGKAVHAQAWEPLSFSVMAQLTAYGLSFAVIYFAFATICFRRRPL
ncbi:ABC transporter permease subunit [Candidatus Sumerlaeota bacterium]|nr:ABC transporter permease subunit [Candidatus Sumerlaeota bacterium]